MKNQQYILQLKANNTIYYFSKHSLFANPKLQEVLNKDIYTDYKYAFDCAILVSEVYKLPVTVVNVTTLKNVLFISTLDISIQRMKDASKQTS